MEKLVNDRLAAGWELHGDTCFLGTTIRQAMIFKLPGVADYSSEPFPR